MTFAWHGHLRFTATPLWIVAIISWGIAFFGRRLAAPANRLGRPVCSAARLKTIRQVVTPILFAGFSVFWLKEPLTWNQAAGFALIALGASLIFRA